ncbi:MAG TPA: DNA polymerase Y family protein [Micromonosporaceae bacterium]|nr:DNA polymerase Y family protein [Micromonosporaceae bacterium]
MRTLVLWAPDWPVIAAGITEEISVHQPLAVLHANRVLACSPAARAEGVRRGLRKREAQGRCPHLILIEHDPGRDARAFEPVLEAVEDLAPGVEVLRPGACALAARGPASYYGGEAAAAERLVEHVALACGVEVQAGIADGVFAAMLAARAGRIVPPGGTVDFLAGLDIAALDRPELVSLLRRLGVHTLADFAALPAADVLARFGFDAAYAHRLAAGQDDRPLAVREPPPDLTVTEEYDPPLERVDVAAFAARALAERLHQRLAGHSMAATRLGIEAHTAAGEELHRVWRHDGLLDAAAIADRVRWQIEGWLTGTGKANRVLPTRPTAGIDRLRLIPEGVVRHAGMQPGLWGELGVADERAHRALVRVQSLLGPDSVLTAVIGGGRGYADRVRLVPWGDERSPAREPAGGGERRGAEPAGAAPSRAAPPWPGQLPAPAPATVLTRPEPIEVCTADGTPVTVDERLAMNGEPATVRIGREPPVAVLAWAGPWPVEERWWAPDEAVQQSRFQLQLADERAILVALAPAGWILEAVYD